MKQFITFFLLFVAIISNAQNAETKQKLHNLSFNSKGRFQLLDENGLVINKKVSDSEMKKLLFDYPVGMQSYIEYKKGRKTALTVMYSGAGIALVGVGVALASLNYNSYINSAYKNETLFYVGDGLIITGFITELVGAAMMFPVRAKGKRLANGYNNYYSKKHALNLNISGNRIGLSLKF